MNKIQSCRLCHGKEFTLILDLGLQSYTGVFRKDLLPVVEGPLELVKCKECDLVQLAHHQDPFMLYGESYGYRSGLNSSMVKHLSHWASQLMIYTFLEPNDIVLDIGSNDGTFLGFFPTQCSLWGIDPTAMKFRRHYKPGINIIPEFFWASTVLEATEGRKAKIVSSVAMLYDLEDPMEFARDIAQVLEPDGIWFFEQSYLPTMLEKGSYDTICHEHLEYYSIKQLKKLTREAGLNILHVELTETNGGSIAIVAGRGRECSEKIKELEDKEKEVFSEEAFQKFAERAKQSASELKSFLVDLKSKDKKIFGYGASTKGNVILQYSKITRELLPAILEVNDDKVGSFTPGTGIQIISEISGLTMNPEYLLVLPWHFRKSIIEREKQFLERGGKLIFPLPTLEVVSADRIGDGG